MRVLFFKHWKLFTSLAAILFWLLLFPVWSQWVTANPLDETITLFPRGKISKTIRIAIPEGYRLSLVFNTTGVPAERLQALLGESAYDKDGQRIPSGVRVPIRWSIREVTSGLVVAADELDSFGVSGSSASEVDRPIGQVKVKPGTYIFSAEIMREVPELGEMNTRMEMALYPKGSSTWQTTLAWWGVRINYYLLRPIALALALLLLWRAIRHYSFRSRG
jgi:Domain of unknown function (DUF5625)